MALSAVLQQTVETLRNALPAPIFDAIGQSIADLKQSGIEDRAPKVGERISLPVLTGADGGRIDLAGLAADGPLVISFYRGGWCPYCSIELRGLSAIADDLKQRGAALVAISPETPDNALATAGKNALGFPVAVDANNEFARSLGIVFALPEGLRPLYRQIGIDLPVWNGDESHELPLPATLIVDRDGVVRFIDADADFTRRTEPEDILSALAAV
ncbi:peroxiredoxin-like family protein [Ensifer soli]|uniref:peroxiredoxin-like family protein n=1 Tax=Ciceribacter sp. sgz301302 TaxID=3342379 RepID=UPI0035B76AB6